MRADGLVMTNAHVVANKASVRVRLHNGKEMDGTVIAVDPVSDLAAIKVDGVFCLLFVSVFVSVTVSAPVSLSLSVSLSLCLSPPPPPPPHTHTHPLSLSLSSKVHTGEWMNQITVGFS